MSQSATSSGPEQVAALPSPSLRTKPPVAEVLCTVPTNLPLRARKYRMLSLADDTSNISAECVYVHGEIALSFEPRLRAHQQEAPHASCAHGGRDGSYLRHVK